MYGRISEHQFYSFPPKPATQTRHRIGEAALGAAGLNQQPGQHLPQAMHVPSRIRQKTMIRVVGPRACRIGKRKHAGDGSPPCTQHPAGYQPNENVGSRGRKNRKKLLKKFRPCRNIRIHIDLPVFFLFPRKTSDGRYVFVDKPLKSAA
ncbi:MAG TPA: hypothetical protein PLR31_08910 [Anaerohalosphaeraceae bacterium]|nr:hypothetical protein [Anaerohalosphaeraceae bacterium]